MKDILSHDNFPLMSGNELKTHEGVVILHAIQCMVYRLFVVFHGKKKQPLSTQSYPQLNTHANRTSTLVSTTLPSICIPSFVSCTPMPNYELFIYFHTLQQYTPSMYPIMSYLFSNTRTFNHILPLCIRTRVVYVHPLQPITPS